jgi:anti-anti-sigma factor
LPGSAAPAFPEDHRTLHHQPLDLVALRRTGFHVGVARVDGTVVIQLQGELDMCSAPALGRDLTEALDGMPHTISLDLSGLTFLDSTGIRVLVSAHRRAAAQGTGFILRSPRPSVLRVLKLTGIDQLLAIDDADAGG